MAKDELNLDELFQGLPHGDRICELYGNSCTCGRDEEILRIKSTLFTHIARLRKIEAAAWPALETYYDIEDEFSESFEVDKEYAVVPDGAGICRLTKKAIAYRKLSTALKESE